MPADSFLPSWTGQRSPEDPSPPADTGSGTPDSIEVRTNDERVALFQLAARWSEAFSPGDGDSPGAALDRFRVAFNYLDAVVHGVEPPDLE
jgi:hypothetical protein